MVSKKSLPEEQIVMSGSLVVDEAARKAGLLLAREFRGPGDTVEGAMSRAERRWGIPFQTFWALRYRKPSDILASIYLRIGTAYEAEVASQEARLRHELDLTRKVLGDKNAAHNSAVAQATAVLGKTET